MPELVAGRKRKSEFAQISWREFAPAFANLQKQETSFIVFGKSWYGTVRTAARSVEYR